MDNSGKVSADGKYLSFTNWGTGNLTIRDLKTGKNIQLTNEATWNRPQQYGEFSMISPDGKQVAYLWYNDAGEKGYYELKLMQVSNQSSTTLYSCNKNEYMVPEIWSSDGKFIYFIDSNSNNLWRVPAEGGMPQKIWSSKDKIQSFSINPNGTQIVLEKPESIVELRVIENLVQELERLDKLAEK